MAILSKNNPLKNVFNERVIRNIASRIQSVFPEFRIDAFVNDTLAPFENLGFLQRSHHLRDTVHQYLPQDYVQAIQILVSSLEPELGENDVAAWDGFPVMSLCSYVSKYGQHHFDHSMNALYEMTKRFSAEGNLRTFLEIDFDRTMQWLNQWCKDPNPHVRRLVSEGTRPRLPLAPVIRRFQSDPLPVIQLLDQLIEDDSLYVRRSVANNINDIAKDNPELAIETLKRWNKNGSAKSKWIVKHACRFMIKQGRADALEIFEVQSEINGTITPLVLNKTIFALNQTLEFSVELESHEPKPVHVILDYVIHYVKANGTHKDKVFKLKEWDIQPGKKQTVTKRHLLRNTATRKHYPGLHYIEMQLNGRRLCKTEFQVTLS